MDLEPSRDYNRARRVARVHADHCMTTSPARVPRLRAGRPYPLGATVTSEGVNFAIYSRHATGVRLLLFDSPDAPEPAHELRLQARSAYVWHGLVEGLRAGALYAYRVEGPYRPQIGDRFNANKLLIDPYAKALHGQFDFARGNLFPYDFASPHGDLSFDPTDDCPHVPRCVVVDDAFDWQGERRPEIRPRGALHLRGARQGLHRPPLVAGAPAPAPTSGSSRRSPTCATSASTRSSCCRSTSSPCEDFLLERGLTNYWGYNTIGFFAPESSLSRAAPRPGCQVASSRRWCASCTAPGIEVILDVVYNHTGEGNELGPTLSLRGIDNRVYYG